MFKQKILKYIFILSCGLALAYPLVHIWIIFPVYQNILIQYTEDDAVRVGSHMASLFTTDDRGITRDSLPEDIAGIMERLSREFIIEKIKIFSSSGEIIFSTNQADEGTINNRSYFVDVVSKGHHFTKLIAKDTKTLEDRLVTADVVETYVPIMMEDRFAGALEIYYDITARNQALKSTALVFSALPFGLMIFFLLAATMIVLGVDTSDSDQSTMPNSFNSPGRLLLFSVLTIFAAELVVMAVLSAMPPMNMSFLALLDSTLLVLMVSPGFYFFFLKPLFTYMAEQQRMSKKLTELSLTDELTGLYNRRGLLAMAEKLVEAAKRTQRGIILLYADLNDLKWVNDNFGHEEGNQLLRETAEILRETFRDSDVIARVGGDEFAVCALNTSEEEPAAIIENRLKETIRRHNEKQGRAYALSISVGVISSKAATDFSLKDQLAQADLQMYEDKENYRKEKIIN